MNASNPNGAEPILSGLASLIPNLEALYKDVHTHPELRTGFGLPVMR
jgi:hypothetical protein